MHNQTPKMASDTKPQPIPIVIYVHGLYGCYLSKKEGSSIFSTGFELPSSLFKSFLFFKNGHNDIALPITWKYETNDDGEQVPIQDYDDIEPCDDFRKLILNLFTYSTYCKHSTI